MTEEQFREMLLFARNNTNKTSRGIEFRGKQENTNEWCYGFYTPMLFAENFEIKPCITDLSAEHMDFQPVIPETIGQFTGLTDKNGKKIFEGDIVTDCGRKGIITANISSCGCCHQVYGFSVCERDESPSDLILIGDCEVIGNIHDNPELLKEGDD